jgi:hypothetical protein
MATRAHLLRARYLDVPSINQKQHDRVLNMLLANLNRECQRVKCQNRGPVQGKEDPTSQEIDIWMPNWMLRPDTHALERVVDRNI